MAIIDALIPQASADVVAIFPEVDGIDIPLIGEIPGFIPVQVFNDARPMRAEISEPAQFMTHPLESGAQVTDHRIILPVEISITFILRPEAYRLTYQLIRQAFLREQRFSIQTKTSTYTGMYIADMPHQEDPAYFDTVTMVIQFREVQFFDAQLRTLADADVIDAEDASTLNRGEQLPGTPSVEQAAEGSRLYRVFRGFF